MNKTPKDLETYISELEDKIIDLSLKLKAQSTLLEATETKNNTLIANLTHNLKNPIGIAYSFSDMILENTKSYTPDKLEKHVNIIRESSQYAINLLNNFVTYHQINSSKCVYNFELKDYTELLKNIVTKFTQNKVKITFINLFENPILLNIDVEKITLVLKQILQNAIRFSGENSEIIVSLKASDSFIETTVTDFGIGISEEDLANVFKDFFVVNTYDQEKQKCIGLGLSTAQNIINKHGGTIAIKSTITKGSRVKIILPITT